METLISYTITVKHDLVKKNVHKSEILLLLERPKDCNCADTIFLNVELIAHSVQDKMFNVNYVNTILALQ